jgi:hypothetical protein
VPATTVAFILTALGPLAAAPFERPRDIDEHFVKERLAEAAPEPTLTLKLRVGLPGLSDPVNVTVCVAGVGGGAAGAAATRAVAAEAAVDDPALFVAVTAARSVEPTSAGCTA